MRQILGLDLQKVVTFDELSVDFKDGLTYVRGLNLDADPAKPTGNGAGKTLMFSTLANLFFQTTPLALKKKAKKDILRQKGSSVGVIYRTHDDGPEYEIIQTSSGYTIYEDGNDLQLRTIPLAEEFIRKLFPLSETKFYSTCYLSTQRPYVLQRDTDSNRLQHLADICNLDQFDGVKEHFNTQLRQLKDNELKLSVLQQSVVDLKRKMKDLRETVSKDEYAKYKADYNKIAQDLEAIKTRRFELNTRQRDLEALRSVEKSLDSLRKRYTFKETPAKMLKSLKEQRAASLSWDRWDQKSEQARSSLKKLRKQLGELSEPATPSKEMRASLKSLDKSIREQDNELSELLSQKKQHDKAQAEVERLQSELDALGVDKIPEGDHESELAVARSTLRLEKLIEHGEHEVVECPTCMTELELDAIRATVKDARKRIKRLEKYVEAQSLQADLKKAKKNVPDFDEARIEKLQRSLKKARAQHDELSSQVEDAEKYESVKSRIAEIEVPPEPDVTRPGYSVSEIDEHMDLCASIVEALSQKELLLANHPELSSLRSELQVSEALDKLKAELESLDARYSKLQTRQSKASEAVTSYEQHRNTHRVYKKELDATQEKIDALMPSLRRKKLLEILIKAYGTKGLRANAAASVCDLWQTNLNFYRDLIFAEPFTFEVHASDTGISVLVDRNNGKKDSVSDVRNLSGAESNSFQLLCLISLLPLMVDSDRVNIAVLDEPTSHMDEVSRTMFNERYLPALREMVPSVFVITPHADDACPNSSEWVVRKQGGVSSLLT